MIKESKISKQFSAKTIPVDKLENTKVSIIMTAHNCANDVLKSIDSILNQHHLNFELIIINDASSDNTLEVLKGCKQKDKRIRIITTTENYGTYVCKNYGMKVSTGDYFIFHDAGDWCEPTYILEALIPLLLDNTLEISMCHHRRIYPHHEDKSVCYVSMCFSRRVFEEMGYFDSVRFAADGEMRRRITSCYGKTPFINNKILYNAPFDEGSLSGNSKTRWGSKSRQDYVEFIDERIQKMAAGEEDYYFPFPLNFEKTYQGDNIRVGKKVRLKTFSEVL